MSSIFEILEQRIGANPILENIYKTDQQLAFEVSLAVSLGTTINVSQTLALFEAYDITYSSLLVDITEDLHRAEPFSKSFSNLAEEVASYHCCAYNTLITLDSKASNKILSRYARRVRPLVYNAIGAYLFEDIRINY